MTKIDTYLDSDERVLWRGQPKFAPFVLGSSSPIVGIILLAGITIFILIPMLFTGAPSFFLVLMIPFLIIPLIMILRPVISGFLAFKNTEYIITHKRVIIQTGSIGLDTRFIDLEKIQEVYVEIGYADRIYNTGRVYAVTAAQAFVQCRRRLVSMPRPSISSVETPYKVQKLLEKAIENAKK